MDTRTVSMETKGVMEQIREHLAQGKSTAEVIALSYKPGTVYKVQRQTRKKPPRHSQELVRVADMSHPVPAGPEDPDSWPSVDDLFEEDEPLALHDLLDRGFPELSEKVEALSKGLEQQVREAAPLRSELGQLHQKFERLEHKIGGFEEDFTHRLAEQVARGNRLEQRAVVAERQLGVLSELVRSLLVMVLHADGHQRGEDMKSLSLVEVLYPPPKWTLWRREEVYVEARQKLLAFLESVQEQHEPLLNSLPSSAPVTTRAPSASRG